MEDNKASFGSRFAAALVDGIILSAINYFLGKIFGSGYFFMMIEICVGLGYFAYLESSEKQATIGKQLLKIKVVDENGERITMQAGVIRYVGRILSAIVILVGYLWYFIGGEKRTWHDILAKTNVVTI